MFAGAVDSRNRTGQKKTDTPGKTETNPVFCPVFSEASEEDRQQRSPNGFAPFGMT
jgi:hypothetical protein